MSVVFYIYLFLFGTSMGSFYSVIYFRLPKSNIAYPPSFCPMCKNELKWYHNIPVISWIFLGGKCGFCKTPISFKYIMFEILWGIFLSGLYYLSSSVILSMEFFFIVFFIFVLVPFYKN